MWKKWVLVALLVGCGLACAEVSMYWARQDTDVQEKVDTTRWRSTVWDLHFSHDGRTLMGATEVFASPLSSSSLEFAYPYEGDNRVRLYNAATGHQQVIFPARPIRGHGGVLLLPDSNIVLTSWGAEEIKSVNISSYRVGEVIPVRTGNMGAFVLSHDAKTFVVGMTCRVEVRDFPSQNVRHIFEHGGQGTALNFGPNDKEVLCWWDAPWKGVEAQCVSIATGQQIHYPRWVYRVRGSDAWQFSPDGKVVALAKGATVELWTTPTPTPTDAGQKLHTFFTSLRVVHALAFSPDSQMLAVGGDSQTTLPIQLLSLKPKPTS